MATYENESKKLLEDCDELFRKFGGKSILPLFEGSELESYEAVLKWSSSATIGAEKMHRFRIYRWRKEGDDGFAPTMLRGSFLLSECVELERPHEREIIAARVQGWISNDGEALVIKRIAPVELTEYPELKTEIDALLVPRSHSDELLGELQYSAAMNHYRGQLARDGSMVLVELQETAPDRVAEQAERLKLFFEKESYLSESEARIREHATFASHAEGDESELRLGSVTLMGNQLTATFRVRPSNLEYACVVAFWQDGELVRLHADHLQPTY